MTPRLICTPRPLPWLCRWIRHRWCRVVVGPAVSGTYQECTRCGGRLAVWPNDAALRADLGDSVTPTGQRFTGAAMIRWVGAGIGRWPV